MRNAIVHNYSKETYKIIAEPYEEIVNEYKRIINEVMNPPKVLDKKINLSYSYIAK